MTSKRYKGHRLTGISTLISVLCALLVASPLRVLHISKSWMSFFQIITTITETYYNFTGTEVFDACLSLQLGQLENQSLLFIESVFDNTECFKERSGYARRNHWHIDDRLEHCPIGTEVKMLLPRSKRRMSLNIIAVHL